MRKKKKIWHFWYSAKQEQMCYGLGDRDCNRVHFGDGNDVKYTECRSDGVKKPSGKWDDYKYLGSLPEELVWKYIKILKRCIII